MTTLNRPSWELSTRRGACRAAAYRRFTRANRRRSAFRQVWPRILLASVLRGALTCATAASADLIEFLAGSKLEGKVTKIDKQARTVTFDAVIAGGRRRPRFCAQLGCRLTALSPLPRGSGWVSKLTR